MVPTALSLGGDGSWRAPMGITVIGGLTLSTILTLLIVPASFSLAVGIEKWIGPKLRRGLLTYKPGDDGMPVVDHDPRPQLPPVPAGRISGPQSGDDLPPHPAE
jgi:hypothetical protein